MIKFFIFFSFFTTFLNASNVSQWGENVRGVVTRFHTDKKEIALTFDACGGSLKSSQYDKNLIDFLIQNKIPATLFINARWIDSNIEHFKQLASNPLFEIANHGTKHRPLSIDGKSIYNIEGTNNEAEVVDEIMGNENKIFELTQKYPHFFRTGTAYYDEEAVAIARKMGLEIAGFSVLGDAGATLSAAQVEKQILSAKPGDIIIAHMNHPESETRAGLIAAIKILQRKGFHFIRLNDAKERLIRIP